jgi:hypothetical protein
MNDKLINLVANTQEDEALAMVKELIAAGSQSHGDPR